MYNCSNKLSKEWLEEQFELLRYPKINFYVLSHPTQIPKIKFNFNNFKNSENKYIANIGAWYRNPFSINKINVPKYLRKCSIRGPSMDNYFLSSKLKVNYDILMNYNSNYKIENKWEYFFVDYIKNEYSFSPELENINFELENSDGCISIKNYDTPKYIIEDIIQKIASVKIIEKLENDKYDKFLSQNIVFLDLVDCSAANTIIECIVRRTPIIIRRLAPIEEYLGKDYPLFYDNLEQVEDLLTLKNIKLAHEYLIKKDHTFLTIEHFIKNFKLIAHECSKLNF